MRHVDAFSRNPIEPAEDTVANGIYTHLCTLNNEDWLILLQISDDKLKHIMEVLNKAEVETKAKR